MIAIHEMSDEQALAALDEITHLDGQLLDERLRELGLDPDDLLSTFDLIVAKKRLTPSMVRMFAFMKMQTLIRTVARWAVEHAIEKHTLLSSLSLEYDNNVRKATGLKTS
jgi:hypothetical protein